MFEKVAYEHFSGRKIYNWLKFELNFYTRGNKPLTLSGVYRILDNTFYYGPFEYPRESGNWYQGKHQPLITQELFEKAQAQLKRDQIVRENKSSFSQSYSHADIVNRAYRPRRSGSRSKMVRRRITYTMAVVGQEIATAKTNTSAKRN